LNNRKIPDERFPFLNVDVLQARILWSIRLRWLAISGYFLATILARFFLSLQIAYHQIWLLLAMLAVINLIYYLLVKARHTLSFKSEVVQLHLHILLDIIFLTLILHLSGGIENPIYLFFIFHVIISSILFSPRIAFLYSTLIITLFTALVILELYRFLPHYSLSDPLIVVNKTKVLITLFSFGIMVYATHYICIGFMKIYRHSKRIIDQQHKILIEADRQKTRFFQFASHELKSPIIAIKSTLDVVLKGYPVSGDEKSINLIRRASNRAGQMLTLVTELLDLTRSQKMEFEQKSEKVDIHQLIHEILKYEHARAQQKNISYELDLRMKNPYLKGVGEDFEKIFSNLINNAILYGKQDGKITISSYQKQGNWYISIEDDGIGIPEKDLESVFNEFFRSQNAKKSVNFGTGLGLSLVKQLVKNYHGTIHVHSHEGKGTIFTLTFPLKRSSK